MKGATDWASAAPEKTSGPHTANDAETWRQRAGMDGDTVPRIEAQSSDPAQGRPREAPRGQLAWREGLRIHAIREAAHAIAAARPAFATISFSVALGRMAVAVFFSHGW